MVLKVVFPLLFICITSFCNAQQKTGMEFTQAESWAEVLAIAKKENKHIFLDAYTTWCGPCIMMAKKVFPQPEVGEFFNANYINVKVQLDTTENDNEKVKKWYKDGNYLMKKYGIMAFPTYIFFSPDGEAVHREIGASDAKTFITKGQDALNPDKQYYRLAREFEGGNRSPEFLYKLMNAAINTYDKDNLPAYSKAFFAVTPNLLANSNIGIVAKLTQSSADTGFFLMQKYPDLFDADAKKKGTAAETVLNIILQEEYYPFLSQGQELVKNPDWPLLESKAAKKYPEYAKAATLRAKIMYYRAQQNFKLFAQAVTELLQQESQNGFGPEMLNGFAWMIFEECDDMECIKQALAWSKKSLEMDMDPMFMDTYANLLHKTNNTPEAIVWQQKAIALLKEQGEDTQGYEETLEKMKKGEKTW